MPGRFPANPVRTISIDSANDWLSGTPIGRSSHTITPWGTPKPLIEIGNRSISSPAA